MSQKNIQENENIIIKEPNKRSAVVILDKTYYKTNIQEILIDKTNYKTNIQEILIDKTNYKTNIQETLLDETNYKLIDTNIDNYIEKSQNSAEYTINH